ncbi:MAG: hypothetical protein E4H14_05560 [Candidatus Thorarchaeota archaeon]|nr:MAG: hypothetical protein E4H14_05560 [Candidatus Thorarchaeota archaeon]
MANVVSSAKELYGRNKIVKWATDITAVLTLLGIVGTGLVKGASYVDNRFVKATDYKALKENQDATRTEQLQQRSLMERQGRQLDFIYLDSLKRDRENIKKELLNLRSATQSAEIAARIGQLVDDLRALEIRVRDQEDVVRRGR